MEFSQLRRAGLCRIQFNPTRWALVVSYGVRVVVMAGCECRDTSSPFHHAYTSANEVMFVMVCLFVCLSVSRSTQKGTDKIS